MKTAITLCSMLLLISCNDNSVVQSDAPPFPSTPPQALSTAPVAYTEFNTSVTIRDIMNTFIDPSADALWQSVRFELDETGAHEMFPTTDEEWEMLRKHAIAIVEGANALMIPGRHVAPPGSSTEFPAYEYLPEEVEAKLVEDRLSWLAFAQGLQGAALSVMEAINARDVNGLSENGGLVDEACESCHSQYWYRAEAAQ